MRSLYFLFSLPLLLLSTSLFSQSQKVSISKAPDWITIVNVDYNKKNLDKHASDGYIDMEYQEQVSLADQSRFIKYTKKLLSTAGVQNASQISVTFDPAYQQIIFHSVTIVRNGVRINKLQLSKIKITNQEDELDDFIYNGSQEALLILEDVRNGDIIECSYTIKGFNPIFKNKYSDRFYMSFDYPFYEVLFKLIVPPGRNINIKNLNQSIQPVITSSNGSKVYEWKLKDLKGFELQDDTPSWFDPYPQVLFSEFSSWKELNDWALQLFPVKTELSADIKNKIQQIEKASSSEEDKVQAVLQFVQDEIRYMGIEMGENSHKPAHPSKVFSQRFGDCKEKSYLASCMLKAMEIEAWPVLINTDIKSSLNNVLPAPTVFDHVTLRVKINNIFYWFDPTIAYQRGKIKDLYYPDYQAGLVISENTTDLTPITFRNNSTVEVDNHFTVTSLSGKGTFIVTSTFKGHHADLVRDKFNNESNSEILEGYKKFYSYYYEEIESDSLTYFDNDQTGIFITKEYYSIPKFWTENKKKEKKFYFSPYTITAHLLKVKEKQRKMPVSLPYPFKYHEEITIELPEAWPVSHKASQINNECFTYSYQVSSLNNVIHLTADFENLKDHVTVKESSDYFRDLDLSEDFADFEVSHSNDMNAEEDTSGSGNLPGILIIGAIAGVFIWWRKRKNKT